MTPTDAAKILELPVDASPEQLEARFQELRSRLEDKIAKAPTPGLKAKYRESLEEITQAFEVLTLAADSSALPVLQRQKAQDSAPKATTPRAPDSPPPAPVPAPAPPRKRKSGGGEFVFVAVIAVALLAGGGWYVMKTREENELKAQREAAAKAETERQAQLAKEQAERDRVAKEAAEKAEKERLERLHTTLRSRMAELNVAYDAAMRTEQTEERQLSELKSQERDLVREQKNAPTPELRRLSATVRAQDRLVGWLRDTLPIHPAKVAKARADELLAARAADDAAAAVDAYALALTQLRTDIADARSRLAISGPLEISSNLSGTTWKFTDGFGIERSGTSPVNLVDIALGRVVVTFQRPGWPDQRVAVDVKTDGGSAAAKFPVGALRVTSEPAGVTVSRGGRTLGVTPFDLPQLPPGPIELRLSQKGFKSQSVGGAIADGGTLELAATLAPAKLLDPENLLEVALDELPQVGDPYVRASLALSLIGTAEARRLSLPAPLLQRLMDAHFAACQEVRDPDRRLELLGGGLPYLTAALGVERARPWAELAAALYPAFTTNDQRQRAVHYAGYFTLYPDVAEKIADTMGNWFTGADDWIYRATVAQFYRHIGRDAAAQRIVASLRESDSDFKNQTVAEYAAKGAGQRQLIPVRLALISGDSAALQRALSAVTAKLDYGDMLGIAGQLIRRQEFDAARQLARLAEGQHIPAGMTLNGLVTLAAVAGEFEQAEKWAATLTDTAENPHRSNGYRTLAKAYLVQNRRDDARRASTQVVNFSANTYSAERIEGAGLFAELGNAARARELAATLTFTKEDASKMTAAAPLYAALGDTATTERALGLLRTEYPALVEYAINMIAQAFARMGKFDEAWKYAAQVKDNRAILWAWSSVSQAQAYSIPEDELAEWIEQSGPGLRKVTAISSTLMRRTGSAAANQPGS